VTEEIPPVETPPAAAGERGAPEAVAVESQRERLRRHVRQVRVATWTTVLVLTIVILVGLIAANTRRVKVSWVFGDSTERLVWIILIAALVGWVAGIATSVIARRRIWRNS
jgi:uncharacterized integral membrane protein